MADPRSVGRIIYGIAVLRYDDRSTGRSGGEYQGASIPEFATDAESAIAYLRSRQEILPDKVGAIGHSEGGFVAFQVAAHKKAETGLLLEYSDIEETFSIQALKDIADWIKAR